MRHQKPARLNSHIINLQEELGVFCVPLPDFLALNFPSPTRVQQNSIIVHPTTSIDPSSITSPNQQNQRQITVQRIGKFISLYFIFKHFDWLFYSDLSITGLNQTSIPPFLTLSQTRMFYFFL